MFQLVIGLIIGVGTLATLKHSSIMGIHCFHLGEFLPTTKCYPPAFYYGPLALAALLIILGVVALIRGEQATNK